MIQTKDKKVGATDWATRAEGTMPVNELLTNRTEPEIIAHAENIVETYLANNGPTLTYGGDRAYYRPNADAIKMPERVQFSTSGEFYSTLFHELGPTSSTPTTSIVWLRLSPPCWSSIAT